MSRYFISYTSADQLWAEWISWQLEKAGHSTIIQAWDFLPGNNFVLEMQNASKNTDATIAVLSKDYLEKAFPASEWASSFVQDPSGEKRTLIPIRVSDVKPDGLLASIVYIDLFKTSDEESASRILINGITPGRKKPEEPPTFPLDSHRKSEASPPFPGKAKTNTKARSDKSQRKVLEIRINRKFEEFTVTEQEKLLNALQALLGMDEDIKIVKVAKGSVLLKMDIQKKAALKLVILFHIGKLDFLEITEARISGMPIKTLDEALAEHLSLEPDQPRKNRRETGVVVFEDTEAGYGIIERDRGGYIKYTIKAGMSAIGLGKRKTLGKSSVTKHPLADH